MNHDPLCPEPDYPIPRKCPSCQNYFAVREDVLDKCIAVVENHFGPKDYELRWLLDGEAVLDALRDLKEKP